MLLNLLTTASNSVALAVATPQVAVFACLSKSHLSAVTAGMTSAAVAVDELISFVSFSKSARMVSTLPFSSHWCAVSVKRSWLQTSTVRPRNAQDTFQNKTADLHCEVPNAPGSTLRHGNARDTFQNKIANALPVESFSSQMN